MAKRKPSSSSPKLKGEVLAGYPTSVIAGVDEVGRGCLAGPVVAAAVVLPFFSPEVFFKSAPKWIRSVKDSKLVPAEKRAELSPLIQGWVVDFAIGVATVEEIDRINIHHASHLAMVRAIEGLKSPPQHILVDGKFVPKGLPCPSTAMIKGDRLSLSIACASIVAKVFRDEAMVALDREYPGYGFAAHKGYGTPDHQAALREKGLTVWHRRSFAPVAQLLNPVLL